MGKSPLRHLRCKCHLSRRERQVSGFCKTVNCQLSTINYPLSTVNSFCGEGEIGKVLLLSCFLRKLCDYTVKLDCFMENVAPCWGLTNGVFYGIYKTVHAEICVVFTITVGVRREANIRFCRYFFCHLNGNSAV